VLGPGSRRRAGALTLLSSLCFAAPALGASAGISSVRASALALATPVVRAELRRHPRAYPQVSSEPGEWQVGLYSGTTEIAEVLVAKADGRILGAYSGYAVAWVMARGLPGEYGGLLDSVWVWVPLSFVFLAPFLQWRRPLAIANLDLLALSAFSISLAFFNNAAIAASVPLVYPPLLYLLARAAWLARPRRAPAPALRLNVPVRWLAIGAVVLVAFRIALNLADSTVIDVGYATVLGAQKVASGDAIYGTFPAAVPRGDTYGPVSYEAYVPFVLLSGFATSWGSLPAAHAAAISFDLLAMGLLFLLGRRVRGPSLGIVLVYAWAAYPFTAFALECNTNEAVLADCVLAALVLADSAPARGAMSALAALTKFAPLAAVPVLLTHRLRETRGRGLLAFAVAFALVAVLAGEPAWAHSSLRTIYERTIGYQAARRTPFSIWGLWGIEGAQTASVYGVLALLVWLSLARRRADRPALAAAVAASLIAVQLPAQYWFYPYVVWFFAPLAPALFDRYEELLDRVGAQPLRAADEDAHQPRVVLARRQPRRHLRHQ
jgi:hypothetical protein